MAIVITRCASPGLIAFSVLAVVHGISGVLIFGLPVMLSLRGETPAGFALVGAGGCSSLSSELGTPSCPGTQS